MFYKIVDIEGIGLDYVRKLEKAGITTTEHLLAKGRDAKARGNLALQTGISDKYLTKWTAMANLMRVRGIGRQYSEQLLEAGVDSTQKLLTMKPHELVRTLDDQKKAKKLSGGVPKLADVEQWQKELRAPAFAHAK